MAQQDQKQTREVPNRHHGTRVKEKPKNVKRTLSRIFQYVLEYRIQLVIVVVAIIGSSLSGVAATYFLKPIINDYVIPLIGQKSPDLSGFI